MGRLFVFSLMIAAALPKTETALANTVDGAGVLVYPNTRRLDLVEDQFGEQVADPYRWLENDVRSDKEVANWVDAQNKVSQSYLEALPQRAWFARRIRELMDYERFWAA